MSLTARDGPVSSYGVVDPAKFNKIMQKSVRDSQIMDPEGIDALSQIDQFESKNKKKPNRYPNANLENTQKTDETMKKKIKLRTKIT